MQPSNFRRKGSSISWKRLLLVGFIAAVGIFAGILAAAGTMITRYARELPSLAKIKEYEPPQGSLVFSQDGVWIGEFSRKGHRYALKPQEIPDFVKKAFVAAEDARFYQHPGVDLVSILRAALIDLRSGSFIQGGSTITQQLIKLLVVGPERSFQRKIKEAILAYRIEKQLTKDEILTLYLNEAPLGSWAWGIEAGSRLYFHKRAKDLTLAEAALLASMPKAPNLYNPFVSPHALKERQRYVLDQMVSLGIITKEEARDAYQTKLAIYPRREPYRDVAPYAVEMVRQELVKRLNEDAVLEGGYWITTTFDTRLQASAQKALFLNLVRLSARYATPMTIRRLTNAEEAFWKFWITPREDNEAFLYRSNTYFPGETVIAKMIAQTKEGWHVLVEGQEKVLDEKSWPRELTDGFKQGKIEIPKPGEAFFLIGLEDSSHQAQLVPEIIPRLQGCLVVLEPSTGKILAIQGGSSFGVTHFNRVMQAVRQPGSAFKPVVYTLAIDKGLQPFSLVDDSPMSLPGAKPGEIWTPDNYDERFLGPITLREALVHSRNVPSVRLTWMFGPRQVVLYAKNMGISSAIQPNLSIALGSLSIRPIELARVYATLANLGKRPDLFSIEDVKNRKGQMETASEQPSKLPQVVSEDAAYIVVNMMQDVVRRGTGARAGVLGLPLAGKTGTTNDFRDAWFMAFMPNFLAGVWVGFDDYRTMGKGMTGATAAIPAFVDFTSDALKKGLISPSLFKKPEKVRFVMFGDTPEPIKDTQEGQPPLPFGAPNEPSTSPTPRQDLEKSLW